MTPHKIVRNLSRRNQMFHAPIVLQEAILGRSCREVSRSPVKDWRRRKPLINKYIYLFSINSSRLHAHAHAIGAGARTRVREGLRNNFLGRILRSLTWPCSLFCRSPFIKEVPCRALPAPTVAISSPGETPPGLASVASNRPFRAGRTTVATPSMSSVSGPSLRSTVGVANSTIAHVPRVASRRPRSTKQPNPQPNATRGHTVAHATSANLAEPKTSGQPANRYSRAKIGGRRHGEPTQR